MANENKGLSTQPIQSHNLFRRKNTTVSDNEAGMVSEARPNMAVNETKTQPYTAVNGTGNPYEYRDQAFKGANKAASANVVGGVSGNAQTQPTYVEKLAEQKEAAKKQYQPGENVSGWINRNFTSPAGGAVAQTNKGNRQTIQNIAALTDVLRHAANLYYTSKGATPQNIQSQVAMNQAKWQAEDALEQQREKARQEMELKRQTAADNKAYKEGQLALGQQRNEIALGNYNIAKDKNDRDAEMHPYNLAAKAAGVEQTKANTERTRVETELAPKKFAEQQRHNRVSEGQGAQRIALSASRLANSGGGGGTTAHRGGTIGKKNDGSRLVTVQGQGKARGTQYYINKGFQDNIGTIYDDFVRKGILPKLMKTDRNGGKYQARPSKQQMVDAVIASMGNANDAVARAAHANFVYWGKKYDYKYVGGMADSAKSILMPETYAGNVNAGFK